MEKLVEGPVYRRSRSETHLTKAEPIWLATDASDWGRAAVRVRKEQPGEVITGEQWSEEEQRWPIYRREMRAVVEAVKHLVDRKELGGEVYLLVDNAAVVSAIRHKYSRDAFLRDSLNELETMGALTRICVIQIPSAKNIADEPSRGRLVEQGKVEECVRLVIEKIELQKGGITRNRPEKRPREQTTGTEKSRWADQGGDIGAGSGLRGRD
jgi:hypothetical protein